VYVQGSLKTYANFLHLDAEALVRELKRRRPQESPPYPLYVGPQEEDSLDDLLAAAGGDPQSRDEDREKAGPALLPAGGYLVLAVFLLLAVAAAALAISMGEEGRQQQAVSQVREPLISRAPETSPPDAGDDTPARGPQQNARQDDGQKDPDEKAEPAGPATEGGEDEVADPTPQYSASATASATASPAAETASSAPERDTRTAAAKPSRRSSVGARASAPASQRSAAPAASPRPAARPEGAPQGAGQSAPPRGSAEMEVKVDVGADDPVQLSGGPFD
jgi:cytoskeletal protein RodZ